MSTATTRENRQPLRSLELFTGTGGLALGVHRAGFRNVALIEWNKDACETLTENMARRAIPGLAKWNIVEEDVRGVSFENFASLDLVAGGPPCQPFSIGGKHRGWNDSRDMIPQFIRAVREVQPRAFILENVKGLTRQAFRNYLSYIQLQLTHPGVLRRPRETWLRHLSRLEDLYTRGTRSELRYNVITRLLNAANYGVPQTRERVFIVGFRSDVAAEWHFPEPTHSCDALLHEQTTTRAYWDERGLRAPKARPSGSSNYRRRALPPGSPRTLPWRTLRDAISDLPDPWTGRGDPPIANHRFQPGARTYVGHTGSPLDWPAKTLKAGVHGVPGGENMIIFPDGSVRYLTVREAARVQTFPDRWVFLGAWSEVMRQLGNAVPMRLSEIVANSVASKLREADD